MRLGKFVCGMAMGCAALAMGIAPAAAQEWKPAKTVELVVGSAPGGSPDVMARLIQNIFQNTGLVPNSTVVNKPGAGNTIGWAYLNQHAGNAHYIAAFSPLVVSHRIMGTTPLNYLDFTPLNILPRSPTGTRCLRSSPRARNGKKTPSRSSGMPTTCSLPRPGSTSTGRTT